MRIKEILFIPIQCLECTKNCKQQTSCEHATIAMCPKRDKVKKTARQSKI